MFTSRWDYKYKIEYARQTIEVLLLTRKFPLHFLASNTSHNKYSDHSSFLIFYKKSTRYTRKKNVSHLYLFN